jgi:hypothetical protein
VVHQLLMRQWWFRFFDDLQIQVVLELSHSSGREAKVSLDRVPGTRTQYSKGRMQNLLHQPGMSHHQCQSMPTKNGNITPRTDCQSLTILVTIQYLKTDVIRCCQLFCRMP